MQMQAAEKARLYCAETLNVSAFIKPLVYQEIPGTRYIMLVSDFVYYSSLLRRVVIVPAWFICDGESVFFKSSTEAGVAHDHLYRKDADPKVSRRKADAVFYELSRLDKSTAVVSWAKWAAVRVFGWPCWKRLSIHDAPR